MDFGPLNEPLLVLATAIGAFATMPILIEFLIDRRKRRQQLALSVDDLAVSELQVHCAGLDTLLQDIEDLIDRARNPRDYQSLRLGNEILILGPAQCGKKTLAQRIAQLARIDRLILVYNPANPDALVRAADIVRSYRHEKVMLLLPRLDLVIEEENEEVLAELDALIENSSARANVLVVGTAVTFQPDSYIDNLFGIKLILPGMVAAGMPPRSTPPELRSMLHDVARYYLSQAGHEGYTLTGLSEDEFVDRVLQVVSNPAEIEDIVVLCETAATYTARIAKLLNREITPQILERSIRRVIVNFASRRHASEAA